MKIELVSNWKALWKSYTFIGLALVAMSPEIYSMLIELAQLWGYTLEAEVINKHLNIMLKSFVLITAIGRGVKQKALEIQQQQNA